eukprot:3941562-Rhodomonas_salina.1
MFRPGGGIQVMVRTSKQQRATNIVVHSRTSSYASVVCERGTERVYAATRVCAMRVRYYAEAKGATIGERPSRPAFAR